MTNDESMTKPNAEEAPKVVVSDFVVRYSFVSCNQDFACGVAKNESESTFLLSALTSGNVSDSIERVKWLALFALLILECSCTTLANRRDLYSPQPDPDLNWQRQVPSTSYAEPASR